MTRVKLAYNRITAQLSARQLSILLTIIALVLWSYSLTQAKLNIGFYGLISSFHVTFFVALGILFVALGFSILSREKTTSLLLLHIAILVTSLWLVPVLLEGTPRVRYGYKFFGFAEYVLDNGYLDPVVVFYHSWPGFSLLVAETVSISGISSPLTLMTLYPFLTQISLLLPLYLLLKYSVGLGDKRVWLFVVIFYLISWTGQDYFSSQSVGFFLFLLLIALLAKIRNAGLTPSQNWSFRLLISIVFTMLVITHYLTSLIVLAIALLWSIIEHVLNKRSDYNLALVFGVILIAWTIYGATIQFERNLPRMVETAIRFDLVTVTSIADRLQGSSAHIAVVQTRMAFSVLWSVLAIGGLLLSARSQKWRLSKTDTMFMTVVFGSYVSIPFISYGGEVVIRTFLLLSISIAVFSHYISRTRYGVCLLIPVLILSIPLHMIAHYGNEVEDYVSPAELAGNDFFYWTTTGGYIVGGIDIAQYRNYGKYRLFQQYIKPSQGYELGLNTPDKRIAYMKERWAEFVFAERSDGLPTYIRLTRGDRLRESEIILGTEQWFIEKKNSLNGSTEYDVVYSNPDFVLCTRVP